MQHAGFDGLHNPVGAMLVALALLLTTSIIIFGSFMVKAAMQREKQMRAEMRRAMQDKQNH